LDFLIIFTVNSAVKKRKINRINMTINKLKILVLLNIGFLLASMTQAQESVNVSGGNATGSGGTVAYSVGQVVYTTNIGSTGSVAQGVQQAYEIFTVGTKEIELNNVLSVFPNPIADNLILQIDDYNNEKLSYQLFDLQGKFLIDGQINAQQTQINTASLPVATYFINVVNQESRIIQSFKIIKN
jgi:hypothetical protein